MSLPPMSPFLLHILIELPASLYFLLRPSGTLPTDQPHAHELIRQYALLLISTNIIAAIFLTRPEDRLSGQVAGAFAIYHVGPFVRAMNRVWKGSKGIILGGPWLHAVVHGACMFWLVVYYSQS